MNNLSLNGIVFNSLLNTLYWNVLSVMLLIDLGNVFSLVFDCVVVCDHSLTRNLNFLSDFFIFDVGSLIWDIFDSTLSFHDWLLGDRNLGDRNLGDRNLSNSKWGNLGNWDLGYSCWCYKSIWTVG